jgi:hypothetical protein
VLLSVHGTSVAQGLNATGCWMLAAAAKHSWWEGQSLSLEQTVAESPEVDFASHPPITPASIAIASHTRDLRLPVNRVMQPHQASLDPHGPGQDFPGL